MGSKGLTKILMERAVIRRKAKHQANKTSLLYPQERSQGKSNFNQNTTKNSNFPLWSQWHKLLFFHQLPPVHLGLSRRGNTLLGQVISTSLCLGFSANVMCFPNLFLKFIVLQGLKTLKQTFNHRKLYWANVFSSGTLVTYSEQ